MAGGSGTRFWPASRRARPKQFLPIGTSEPLICSTRARVAPLVSLERTLVVAGAAHAELVRETLPDLPAENLLLEPVGRNTLPCVALAAAEVRRRDPRAIQAVFPADHVIAPEEEFRTSLRAAVAEAAADVSLVTLGVRPTYPATGYGYIERGDEAPARDGHRVYDVARFVEKPDRERAERFLASGRFLWNSGIFVWSTDAIVAALQEHAPREWDALRDARPADLGPVYERLDSTPVDVAILEKAARRRVLPLDVTWSDVGTWAALAEVLPADAAANHVSPGARVAALDASGNVVHGGREELVALIGVTDLVVVRAGDVTLVCPRDRAQDVKDVVARLERDAPEWT